MVSLLSGGGQRQSMHVIPNTRIHQQITNIVYSEPRIGVNQNFDILEYWHIKRDDPNWKELYNISQVVFGAAFSQVKVEQDFSSFAMVYTHLRTRLSDETLNAMLVVRQNLDLLDKVKFFQ